MMDDLISRQAVLEATSAKLKITGKENAETVYGYIKKLCDDIKALPSADVQPVRHVRWIRHTEQKNIFNGKAIECSECGEKYVVQYIEDEKFCRNCGARMDGEQDG